MVDIEDKDKCPACGKEYVSSESKVQEDSHHTYIDYNPCPNCKYTPEIKDKVGELLEEKTKIKFTPSEGMTMNTEELTDLITKVVIKNWPKPKKK